MMNILVTGGCGFIGSNVLNYMTKKYSNYMFYNIDKLDYCSNEDNIQVSENYKFIYGNICDSHLVRHVLEKYSVDTIIHFAAQTHVDNSFGNSLQFTQDNIVGTHVLLECAKDYGKLKKFLHMSTDEVYGEVDIGHEGCDEKALLNPTNPYSATKAAAEFLCRAYYQSFKLPVIIVRGNNVYGPNQYPEKLIPKFIKLLSEDKKCTIHGSGETRRNFIHSYDVASAIDVIYHKGIVNNIYNIGTKNEYSVNEIYNKLCSLMNKNHKENCVYVEDRNFNDYRYAIDSTKLKELGWKETKNFETEMKILCNIF